MFEDRSTLRVLVVDDDEIAAEHARMVLDEVGIRADVCTSGAEALRMMDVRHTKQEPYDLVLMDWNLPEMNGLETSEKSVSNTAARRPLSSLPGITGRIFRRRPHR